MANTLHGPFVKGASLSTGSYGTGGGQVNTYTSGNANNDETQSGVALHSFNPHMIGAGFVLSGAVCTKDGSVANQLDIASGEAYLIQSDGTPTLCDIGADNTHTTTGNPSTTMYLDLNPDGSWSWSTSHSAVSNHLTICSVTTDGSANIATVVDARPLNPTLLPTLAGSIEIIDLLISDQIRLGAAGSASGDSAKLIYFPAFNSLGLASQQGAAGVHGLYFQVWDGSTNQFPFSIGLQVNGAPTWINTSGGIAQLAGQATAGSFGAPVIVAQALSVNVTTTGLHTILSYTPAANGLYRVSGYVEMHGSAAGAIFAQVGYTDDLGTPVANMAVAGIGATNPVLLNGATSVGPSLSAPLFPVTFYAKSTGAIQCVYSSPNGTPNDHIWYVIERLS